MKLPDAPESIKTFAGIRSPLEFRTLNMNSSATLLARKAPMEWEGRGVKAKLGFFGTVEHLSEDSKNPLGSLRAEKGLLQQRV